MAKLEKWIWQPRPKPTLEQRMQQFADSLTKEQKRVIYNKLKLLK